MRKLNKNKLFYTCMGLLIIGLIVFTGVKAYKEFFTKEEEPTIIKKELDSLELYGYTLDDYDSELYKEYFEELKTVLKEDEVNFEDYAKSIVKLFVTDFYSLDSKITSSDIGGIEFIYPALVDNFKLNAGDTMYNTIKTNINGDRVQELPMVSKVKIENVEENIYTYNEKEYSGYKVKASWEYKKDLGYEEEGTYIIIKDSNKLYIVEGD